MVKGPPQRLVDTHHHVQKVSNLSLSRMPCWTRLGTALYVKCASCFSESQPWHRAVPGRASAGGCPRMPVQGPLERCQGWEGTWETRGPGAARPCYARTCISGPGGPDPTPEKIHKPSRFRSEQRLPLSSCCLPALGRPVCPSFTIGNQSPLVPTEQVRKQG